MLNDQTVISFYDTCYFSRTMYIVTENCFKVKYYSIAKICHSEEIEMACLILVRSMVRIWTQCPRILSTLILPPPK